MNRRDGRQLWRFSRKKDRDKGNRNKMKDK